MHIRLFLWIYVHVWCASSEVRLCENYIALKTCYYMMMSTMMIAVAREQSASCTILLWMTASDVLVTSLRVQRSARISERPTPWERIVGSPPTSSPVFLRWAWWRWWLWSQSWSPTRLVTWRHAARRYAQWYSSAHTSNIGCYRRWAIIVHWTEPNSNFQPARFLSTANNTIPHGRRDYTYNRTMQKCVSHRVAPSQHM